MKVLHLINDASIGGAETLVEALANRRIGLDEAHLAVLLGRGSLSTRLEGAFDTVTYFDVPRSPLALPLAVHHLRRLALDLRPEIVHSHLTQSDLVNAIARHGAARVSTFHNTRFVSNGLMSKAATVLAVRLMRRLDAVVACDDSSASYLKTEFPDMHVQVVRNGVSIPPPVRNVDRPKVLLSLASFRPQKAHDVMLEAFGAFRETHPEWILRLAGDRMTEGNNELEALVSRFVGSGLGVELLGPVDAPEELLRDARALVISSDFEGLPMAALEATAAGVPLVSTDVGGCSTLVADPHLLVPTRSPLRLARALEHLASMDGPTYASVCERTQQLVAGRYDITETARNYRNIYGSIMVSQRRNPEIAHRQRRGKAH